MIDIIEHHDDKYSIIEEWYKKNTKTLHREDEPAIKQRGGSKFWCINGKYHREDGPAVEIISRGNSTYNAWYYRGIYIPVKSQEAFKRYIEKLIVLM